jgi:metal-dependent HD superfamily phosphatase/phosphodiesterase
MDIESSGFYKIYELLDEKIKDSIIQNLQKIFNKKKIKLNVDLMDIFDEE